MFGRTCEGTDQIGITIKYVPSYFGLKILIDTQLECAVRKFKSCASTFTTKTGNTDVILKKQQSESVTEQDAEQIILS